MLSIKKFTVNPLGENCYLVINDLREAAIIDCGAYEPAESQMIDQYIEKEGIELKYVLQTHGHFDHIFGLPHLHRKYGLHPLLHQGDQQWYDHANDLCIAIFGVGLREPMPAIGAYLTEGMTISLGTDVLKVICTPGHTPGGVCFYNEDQGLLFSGDTLFCGSVGRTDMDGGDQMQEIRSICEKLLVLPDDVQVFPGHGPATTIGYERENNYYLR